MPTGAFDADSTLAVVESERVTSLFLVPAQWQVLCAHPDATARTTSLRAISWGAAPATVSLLETMAADLPARRDHLGVRPDRDVAGDDVLPGADAVRKIGSVGKPIPTIAARVVDEDMNDVAARRGRRDRLPRTDAHGRLLEQAGGDRRGLRRRLVPLRRSRPGRRRGLRLRRRPQEGHDHLRRREHLLRRGRERARRRIRRWPTSRSSARAARALGRDAGRRSSCRPTRPPRRPSTTSPSWSRDRLASYKKPTALVVLDELPRNASGKVLKHVLRETYG